MKSLENQFKKALRQDKAQIGFWLGLANPYTAEICAGAGFDWLLIDGEHAPNDIRSILEQLQAVCAYPTNAVVRPVNSDPNLIKQLLDIGAQTLLVPMVESAEQVTAIMQAMHYPPHGIRGVGTALARAASWNRTPNYLAQANEQMCLLVQVESVTGVQNLESILKLEGLDGVFIGPADLAASMGFLGQPSHLEVQTAIETAIKIIRASGKAAGILATDQKLAKHYIQLGANFVAVGVDTMLLANGTTALVQQFRSSNNTASDIQSNGAYD